MTGDPRVTERLAEFLVASRWEDIPAPVRHEGVRTLLNFVGGALGGSQDEAVSLAAKVLMPYFGGSQASVIGRRERPDALNAAFLNAISANVLEYDDTHLPTVIHPAAPVAPGLFALAEQRRISGAALVHALILGVEAECRIGNAVMPTHYRRGWHITATCGIFGAAAAAGKLLGLDKRHMAWALGHAATQSAGSSRASAACRRASGSATPPKTASPPRSSPKPASPPPTGRSRGAMGLPR